MPCAFAAGIAGCGGGSGGTGTPADPANRSPVLAAIADSSLDEGTSVSVEVTATDADGDVLTLQSDDLPDFVTAERIDATTWRLTLAPGFDDAGTYSVVVRVVDTAGAGDEETLTLTVSNVNRPPTLESPGDLTLGEGQTQTTDLSASDADGDALTFASSTLPDFVTLTDNGDGSAQLRMQPGYFASGIYNFSVQVRDTGSTVVTADVFVTVTNVNRAPLVTPPGQISVLEAGMLDVLLGAIDPDGDPVTLSVSGAPAFASAIDNGDGSGVLSLAPGFSDSGSHPFVLSATDGGGLSDQQTGTIDVIDVNRAPTLSAPAPVSMAEDETSSVAISATDADADGITLSLPNAPDFATLTDSGNGSGTLLLEPGFQDSGAYGIVLRATDAQGAMAEATLSLDVTNVNRPPAISALPDMTIAEDETSLIAVDAADPDDDDVTLIGIGLPAFASFTDNGDGTGSIDMQPTFDDSGVYTLSVRASDAMSLEDETSFELTVDDVNRAPILADIADPIVAEGKVETVALDASDPDGHALAFEADSLPDFVTLSDAGNGTGELRIAPQALDSGSYAVDVRVNDAGTPALSDEQTVQITVNLTGPNHVAYENSLPGTADWHLDDPALQREIEGYASATSVNRGDPISFYVNTSAATYTLEVFRTGWYGGDGARRLLGPITIAGTAQTIPAPDPTTGLVEANWSNPYEIYTRGSVLGNPWTTGVYLARLTESADGKQSYIIFVVRDDAQPHDVLLQLPVTTYQAYNAWGGKSVYDWNSGASEPWGDASGLRASHVSFDRPYARNPTDSAGYGMGAGEYLTNVQPIGRVFGAAWDYNMVRWLEHEQYDVAYITNVDTHRSPDALLNTELFLSQGHDEYWSWEMRDNVEGARDAGTDLAFFSSNTSYYQIRFEPSPTTAVANRVMVVYKDEALDPVFGDLNPLNDYLTTVPFRYDPVLRPEEQMIGVQYVLDPYDGDIIVYDAAHWVFDKTGFANGSVLEGLLGYEPDGMFIAEADWPSREVLAQTPVVSSVDPGVTGTSHMTIYSTPAASVFATGSFQWSWGLDDYNAPQLRPIRTTAMAQQVTENVLAAFGALPHPGDDVVPAACVRIESFADATDDQTMAAAEFDLLDEDGRAIPKSGWSVNAVDSEETAGWDHQRAYAIDDDPATVWQTSWDAGEMHPHFIEIDLGGSFELSALRYVPRQDGGAAGTLDGTVTEYAISTSPDCASWSLVAAGTDWTANRGRKLARFQAP